VTYILQLPLVTEMKGKYWFFAIRLSNKPGVLSKVSGIFAKANINILNGVHTITEAGHADWVLLADFTNSKVEPSEIAEKLAKLPEVINVDYGIKVLGELGFPAFDFKLVFHEENVSIWRATWFTTFFGGIAKYFKESGEVFLYQTAYVAGYMIAKWWMNKAKTSDPLKLIQLAGEALKVFGWIRDYEVSRFQYEPLEVVIRIKENIESQAHKNLKIKTNCYFMMGLLAGYIAGIFNRQMIAREPKCEALGNEFCEYHIVPYKAT